MRPSEALGWPHAGESGPTDITLPQSSRLPSWVRKTALAAILPSPAFRRRAVAMGAIAGVTSYHDVDGRKPANDGG